MNKPKYQEGEMWRSMYKKIANRSWVQYMGCMHAICTGWICKLRTYIVYASGLLISEITFHWKLSHSRAHSHYLIHTYLQNDPLVTLVPSVTRAWSITDIENVGGFIWAFRRSHCEIQLFVILISLHIV